MSPYTMLSSLSPQSDSKTILVRVGRIWQAINRKNNTLLHTNVILIDEKGDHMLAMLRNNQKDTFLPLLKEEEVYCISNLKLVPGPNLYRSVNRDLSVNFVYKTKIEHKRDSDAIPRFKFELQHFDNVKNLVGQIKCLIDVIGMVRSYGQLEKRTNGAEKMDVVLSNIRDEKILVTLWEDKAAQFMTSLAEKQDRAHFVVITGLLAKNFSNKPSLSSTDATRTYFNIDYAPLNTLRQDFCASIGKTIVMLPPPTITQFVSADDSCVQEQPISSILEVQIPAGKDLVRCLCKGTIVEILNGNGWYYICCPKCARIVRPVDGKFYCNNCAEEANPFTQRYRVVVRIEDGSATTTLTLFNKEAEQLIGVPLQKLLTEMGENAAMSQIPAAVKNIIGKTCAFQIKITSYNITQGCEEYTVTRVSECSTSAMNNDNYDSTESLKKKQKCA